MTATFVILFPVQPEKSLSEVWPQPYFRLLIQGDVAEVVTMKISTELQMLEAGSSILEGLDRLFKLFWIFGIEYTPGCANFYRLLNGAAYKLECGSVPKSVAELTAVLQQCHK